MAFWVCLVLLLAFSGHTNATYCICKDGLSDSALQKTIDYACGSGADCSAILQNGACYNPNTIKNHCDYAANNYFQKKGQTGGTCDFSGTATTSSTIPSQVSGCVYPTSASSAGTTTTPSTSTTNAPPSTTTGTSPYGGMAPSDLPTTNGVMGLYKSSTFALLTFLGLLLLW